MELFSITRKEFLDRVFTADELASLAEMFRQLYFFGVKGEGEKARVYCSSRIYCFPQTEKESIREALISGYPDGTIGDSDPDEILLTGPSTSSVYSSDISAWLTVLSEPLVQNACVILRWTVEGPMMEADRITEPGHSTFVFCGAPSQGSILLKAIWHFGADESLQRLFRLTAFPQEKILVEAFSVYLRETQNLATEVAAESAARVLGKHLRILFQSRTREANVMMVTRHLAELPDDRGPASFFRRLGFPLLVSIATIMWGFFQPHARVIAWVFGTGSLFLAARIGWKKLQQIQRYYKSMRKALGAHYASNVEYRVVDLSQDKSPTLIKLSREIEALGGRLICDLSMSTARAMFDANRIFVINNTIAAVGTLTGHIGLKFFPPVPILILKTKFKDGRQYFTTNQPLYRKTTSPDVTGRCMLNEGGVNELISVHFQSIERILSTGNAPISPPTSAVGMIEMMQIESKESRELWKKSPYSWSDAFHQAFKICRREYL